MNTHKIKEGSSLMEFFRRIGLDSIAWSLRRIYCPVNKSDLVLEVGSGGNPYYRANILCDAYLDTEERFFEKLVLDRPIVLALAENLPFKDDTFDFVIASHVLEHSKEPEKFIKEIQRVGKAGYIEVPDAFMERLTNYGFHMLEITDKNDELFIRKKRGQIQDEELWNLFKNKTRGIAPYLFSKYPFNFHVRYYWRKDLGGIKYKILNPEYKFNWEPMVIGPDSISADRQSTKTKFKRIVLFLFRKIFSQNKRNRNIRLEDYLICLKCGGAISKKNNGYKCVVCGYIYLIVDGGIPNFNERS